MTDDELDRVLEVREDIERKVTALVSNMILNADVTPEQAELIRLQLTENYRFWK